MKLSRTGPRHQAFKVHYGVKPKKKTGKKVMWMAVGMFLVSLGGCAVEIEKILSLPGPEQAALASRPSTPLQMFFFLLFFVGILVLLVGWIMSSSD